MGVVKKIVSATGEEMWGIVMDVKSWSGFHPHHQTVTTTTTFFKIQPEFLKNNKISEGDLYEFGIECCEPITDFPLNLTYYYNLTSLAVPIIPGNNEEEELLIEFANWLSKSGFEKKENGLWRPLDLPFEYTTEEIIKEFKKDIGKL